MYHRFNENKYPSTNIKMDVFNEQMISIKKLGYNFSNPKLFIDEFDKPKEKKQILITIDDGFKSFYNEAWPYLKKNKIPFILFVSTEPVGKNGYMTWDEIKEIDQSEIGHIGHHSHTHEYLIDMTEKEFVHDIEKATKIFKRELGYVPSIFSYPFGEYSLYMKKYISKNFKLAFGQHSGIIDINKDKYELPRFPINEKYGELKRFNSLINYNPLEYKSLKPEEKKLNNDGGNWKKSKLKFERNSLIINFQEPFVPRRGRINCSLNDDGKWRWFGTQFTVKSN